MRRVLILVVAVLMLAGSTSAGALGLAGFGSYANTSDLDDSFGFGGKIDFRFGQSAFFLEGRGTYYPEFEKTILNQKFKVSALPLEIGPGVAFGNFFVSGGLSYFMLDPDNGSMDDAAGFYLAGGLKKATPGIGFFAEAMYRWLNSTVEVNDNEITINKEDIDLSGFGINVGISFNF